MDSPIQVTDHGNTQIFNHVRVTNRHFNLICSLLLGIVTPFGLSACSKSADPAQSQTIAKAQGVEITIHELRHSLGDVKTDPTTEKRLLETMVDQTLLSKKATDEGMEKDPKVALSIAAAKRSVLAQAYAEKISAKSPIPTEQESKQYYDKNPQLFAQRKLYAFKDFGVPSKDVSSTAVREAMNGLKTIEALKEKLGDKVKSVPIRQRAVGAEELPLEVGKAFASLKQGSLGLVMMPNQTQVILLMEIKDAPVSFVTAKPAIERMLVETSRREKLTTAIQTLRKEGRIEYLGSFANMASNDVADSESTKKAKVNTPTDRGIATMQ
jgi:EpsD family peptidyl-prolyl cis-trans isomerase